MRFPVPHEMIEKAARKYEYEVRQRREHVASSETCVITLSRQFGAGGRQVALRLQQRLGWTVWDKAILDELASQSGGTLRTQMFEALDERAQSEIEALVNSALGRTEKHTYFMLLPRGILTIAQNSAIILGRGAHLLLPDAFRVNLLASVERRITNLIELYDLDYATAREEVTETDAQRDQFMKQFRRHVNIPPLPPGSPEFDLELNTEKLSFDEVAMVVETAVRCRFGLLPTT